MTKFIILFTAVFIFAGCATNPDGYSRRSVERPDVGLTSALHAALNDHDRALVVIADEGSAAGSHITSFWNHHRFEGEVYFINGATLSSAEKILHEQAPFFGSMPTCFIFQDGDYKKNHVGFYDCTITALDELL